MPSELELDTSLGNMELNMVFPDAADIFVREDLKERVYDEFDAFTFGETDASAKLVYHGPWNQIYATVQFLYGLDYVTNTGGTYRLRRIPPSAHPMYPDLRCVGAEVRSLLVEGDPQTLKVKTRPSPAPTSANPTREKHAVYRVAEYTVSYAQWKCPVLPDEVMGTDGKNEHTRFCEATTVPSAPEMLAIDGQRTMTFKEAGPLQGQTRVLAMGVVKPVNGLQILWRRVPDSWLYQSYTNHRLDKYLGCLNQTEFFGKAPGTLRFDSFDLSDTFNYRIRTLDPRLLPRGTNVKFFFQHADPENAVAGSTKRGHNLLATKSGGGSVKHAYAEDQDGQPEYPREAEFRELFWAGKRED